MVRLGLLLVLLGAWLPAQQIELGPAPLASAEPPAAVIADATGTPGNWYDTSSRATVRDLYNSILAPTNNVNMGASGQSPSGCQAGDTSQTWKNAVLTRINWFRGLAGIPMGVTLDATFNAKDQQAALMMSANKALSHNPPQSWSCYTADGAQAAGSSNICYLYGYGFSDPGCVAGYIEDSGSNNAAVGHRRWLLYPKRTTFGTGDIAQTGTYPRTNAIWVFGAQSAAREARDNYVAWPPKGYFPYPLLPGRWSFSYPNGDFSQATVTMTRDGSSVPVTLEPIANGYGENTIVWLPSMPAGNPGNDSTVSVSVNNVRVGGVPQNFSYQVIVFDPAVEGGGGGSPATVSVTVTSSPAGRSVTVDGANYTTPQTFNWTVGSTHSLNADSPQTSAGTRYVFSSWSQGGGQSQTVVVPSTSTTYSAAFLTQHLLTANVTPFGAGSVSATPFSADGWYNSGTSVQLTAAAASGYQFTQWSGDAGGSSPQATVSMNAPRTVTASFSETGGTASVTVTSNPPGRSVTVDGNSYTTPQTFSWTPGSSHALNTTAIQTNGGARYVFAGWSQGGAQQQTVVTPSGSTTYTASFAAQYLLTANVLPAGGGTVARSPSSPDGWYDAGTSVQLTATANVGALFQNWTGDLNGAANPAVIVMNAARGVTAHFSTAEIPQCTYSLDTASASVSGQGALDDFRLATQEGCAWTAAPGANWITISGSATGTGPARVRYAVAANTSAQARSATIHIGGLTFRVDQAGASCEFTLAPQSQGVPAAGGTYQLGVGTAGGCTWNAAVAPSWIAVAGGSGPYSGPLTLSYTVAANESATPRTGSITVGGTVLQILQSGAGTAQLFGDVALNHPFADHITLMGVNGITSGCGGGNYCPDATTTRGEMAVFLVRSLVGTGSFAYSQTPYFDDVPASHPFFAYIQKLRELGVTNGCSAAEYCPGANVTREQMALFLVRALLGISAGDPFPFPPNAFFTDVPASHPFFGSIQKMREYGITSGCTATEYCGAALTTRGQMAVFLIRAFLAP